MTDYKIQQIVEVETSDLRPLEDRLRHWERALVGQLARQVHTAGEEFSSWPTIERDEATVGGSVVVTVTCTGLPRQPWHVWRSNVDPDVRAYDGRDHCTACGMHRSWAGAVQPCEGKRS